MSKQKQASFSLIETMVAIGILATLILNINGIQGNAIVFNQYSRNMTKAIWLAKRIMSQVEHDYMTTSSFRALSQKKISDGRFEDEADFSYKLRFVDWNLDIAKLLGGNNSVMEGAGSMVSQTVKNYFKDGFFKIAVVEVLWGDGAKQNSMSLSYLLANHIEAEANLAALRNRVGGSSKTNVRQTKKTSHSSDDK